MTSSKAGGLIYEPLKAVRFISRQLLSNTGIDGLRTGYWNVKIIRQVRYGYPKKTDGTDSCASLPPVQAKENIGYIKIDFGNMARIVNAFAISTKQSSVDH